jgi:hypothetical protein
VRLTVGSGVMTKKTSLALRGIESGSDSSVVFKFAAGGEEFSWRFKAATFDELVALALDGRLGKGRDVHFDGAKVTFKKGKAGLPGSVRIAIGRKVRIVVPAPVRGKAAAATRKAVGEEAAKRPGTRKAAVRKTPTRRTPDRRKTPIA